MAAGKKAVDAAVVRVTSSFSPFKTFMKVNALN